MEARRPAAKTLLAQVFAFNIHFKVEFNFEKKFVDNNLYYSLQFELLVLSPGDGIWGSWFPSNGKWDYCNASSFVTGFQLRMQSPQGYPDDSALNSIELTCGDGEGNQLGLVERNVQASYLYLGL